MKIRALWKYTVIGIAVICLALPVSASGQETPVKPQEAPAKASGQETPAQPSVQQAPAQPPAQQASAKAFKQEELDQLLAPIALHPDNVLTNILIASTYPLEVAQAQQWLKENKGLKGDALKAALEKKTWDVSVKALVTFPDVLTMMSEKLEWTQKLGDAFLAQQKDVMDTVQKLRKKALEAGNLKDSKEQEVKKEGDIIIIQSADPQVVYVPTYNTTVVYGTWPYPAYPPYPVYVYPPGAAAVTFTMGVAIGAAWYGHGCYPDYHGGAVYPPPPPPPPGAKPPAGSQPKPPGSKPPPGTKPSGGAKPEQWKHNPEHRKGVAYKDSATRDKYSPTNRAGVDNRKDYRGYDNKGAGASDRSVGKQPAQKQDKTPGQSGSGAKSNDNAFGGVDRGGQAQQDSTRGNQSMSSSKSHSGSSGSSSGGASRGGGGGGGGRGRR